MLQKGAQGPKLDKKGHGEGCPRVIILTQDGVCVISTGELDLTAQHGELIHNQWEPEGTDRESSLRNFWHPGLGQTGTHTRISQD